MKLSNSIQDFVISKAVVGLTYPQTFWICQPLGHIYKAARNAPYTLTDAVTDYFKAIREWTDRLQQKQLLMLYFYFDSR